MIKDIREAQARLITEARAKLDEITKDTPEARAQEIESQFDAMMTEADALEARAKRAEALEAREAALNAADERRPGQDTRAAKPVENGKVDINAAFRRAMQFGTSNLSADERRAVAELRAQTTGTGSSGGYTIPGGYLPELEKALLAFGPMLDPGVTRQLVTATGNTLMIPTFDDTSNVGRLLAENAQVTETDVSFGQKQLDAFTYSSDSVLVPLQLLQDSAFDMDKEVIQPAFGERIGRIVNTHLTTGTGSSQPNGIVTASTLGVTAASATAIAADELISFYHSIDPAYRSSPNFRVMFSDSTLSAIRKLKDGMGNYLIDGLKDGGATINIAGISVPYVVNQAMANIATGNKVLVAGDFSKYLVRKVKDFTMLRLVERYADYLQVGFVAYGRFDGECVNTSAIKHFKMA